jgi:hypothetical protein
MAWPCSLQSCTVMQLLLLSQEGFRFRGQGRALPFRLPSGQYEIKKEIQCQCVLVVVSITDALISATSCMNAEKALSDHTLEQDRLSSASPDLDGGGGAHEDTKRPRQKLHKCRCAYKTSDALTVWRPACLWASGT